MRNDKTKIGYLPCDYNSGGWKPLTTCDFKHLRESGYRGRYWSMRQVVVTAPGHACELCERKIGPKYGHTHKGRGQPVLKPGKGTSASVRNAIDDGEDLARTEIILPYDGIHGIPRPMPGTTQPNMDLKPGDDGEEELQDDVAAAECGDAHCAQFSLGSIPRPDPTFTIQVKARKRRNIPVDDNWDMVSVASAHDFVKV